MANVSKETRGKKATKQSGRVSEATAGTIAAGPDQAAVAKLAYQFFEREGRPAGRALEHWLRAEAELQSAAS